MSYNPSLFGSTAPQPLYPTPDLSFGSAGQQVTLPGGLPASMDWLKTNQQPDVLGGVPGVPGVPGAGASPLGFGMNLPTLQLGMGALQMGAGLYTGIQSLGLANKQFKLSREMANTNLNNSIASYNTSLEDRVRARHGVEGKSSAETDAYIGSNKLTR